MAADLATGSTVAFATTTTFVPLVTDISFDGMSVASILTSHLGTTGYHTYIPGEIKEGGTVTLQIYIENYSNTNKAPPLGVVDTITIILITPTTGYKLAFPGFVQEWTISAINEQAVTGTVVIKVAGAITPTAAS